MLKRMISLVKGRQAEHAACLYLQRQGLQLIVKNFHSRGGEIDLIMRDQQAIVFVEVRYRHNDAYGSGGETVTYTKRKKIFKTAEIYLQQQKLLDKVACRFDVIEMAENTPIKWIKDAFHL